jgi:hypothetical protein
LYKDNFQLPFTDNRQSLKESQKYQKYLDLAGAFVNERVQTNDQEGTEAWDFFLFYLKRKVETRDICYSGQKIYGVIKRFHKRSLLIR